MPTSGHLLALLPTSFLTVGILVAVSSVASAQPEAITATVTGAKIQQVGFRAMVQKQAIMLNLAGSARNNEDKSVTVELQGDKGRVDQLLAAMRVGSKSVRRHMI